MGLFEPLLDLLMVEPSKAELVRKAVHYLLRDNGLDDGLICDREEMLESLPEILIHSLRELLQKLFLDDSQIGVEMNKLVYIWLYFDCRLAQRLRSSDRDFGNSNFCG